MTPRTLRVSVDLSASEAIDFAVLCAKFKLADGELAGKLIRYALSLASGAADSTAGTVEHHLDERVSRREALVDELRAAIARSARAAQSVEIVNAIARERLLSLPLPKQAYP